MRPSLAVLLPFLTACLGETVEVPRELTAAELAERCKPASAAGGDALALAQDKVAELERATAEQQGQVRDLEDRVARGEEAARAQLSRSKAELAATESKLVLAEAEKTRLLDDLRETQADLASAEDRLAVTTGQRDAARDDAVAAHWRSFLDDAQLEICEKGNRKKLGDCREVVLATLETAARRDRYAHCLRSGQARPLVHERAGDAEIPRFAQMLDEDSKQVKGWYVEFCDPTLPETTDPVPASTP